MALLLGGGFLTDGYIVRSLVAVSAPHPSGPHISGMLRSPLEDLDHAMDKLQVVLYL